MSVTYLQAQSMVLDAVAAVEAEYLPLEQCSGRVLAQDFVSTQNVPPFDRSAYDGYAFRATDTTGASKETPVVLRILGEIPAGGVPCCAVAPGTAVKILTGAPIPEGADAVIKFERVNNTDGEVQVFEPCSAGQNIVRVGEDVEKGTILARSGSRIDSALLGALASQNVSAPLVYRVPRVGILSTGSELLCVGMEWESGKIYNSNRYTLDAALQRVGCATVVYENVGDDPDAISEQLDRALWECDAVVLTGGVSVGDYDFTPAAMEKCDVRILFRGVHMKPGMACAYGVKDGKLVCALSGNPASSLTNFYAIALPAFRKLCGEAQVLPKPIRVTLMEDFKKKSPSVRFLRGTLELSDGTAKMHVPRDQGNVILSSMIGCNVLARIPEGSGPLPAGTVLDGFLI